LESDVPLFLIHYDLPQKPDVEHPDLIPILTRIGARRITATAWAVRTEMELTAIRDELQLCILPGDRLVIAQISEWRAIGTMTKIDRV
jgi:hypothetical protein